MEIVFIILVLWFGFGHDEAGTLPHQIVYGSECVEEGHGHPIKEGE